MRNLYLKIEALDQVAPCSEAKKSSSAKSSSEEPSSSPAGAGRFTDGVGLTHGIVTQDWQRVYKYNDMRFTLSNQESAGFRRIVDL